MRLDQLYRGSAPDISIELFPPKTPEGVELLNEGAVDNVIAFLEGRPRNRVA